MTVNAVSPEAEDRRGDELTDAKSRHDPAEEDRVCGHVNDLQKGPHRAHGDRERHGREEHDHIADFHREEPVFQLGLTLLCRYGIPEPFTLKKKEAY